MNGTTYESPISIREFGVPYGLLYRRTEPGYVLEDGTVLLECERDEYGRYRGGAGMDGMYMQTGRLYAPVHTEDGQISGFREIRPENYLAAAEMGAEQNYNMIDGIINNESPREQAPEPASIRDRLRQYEEQAVQDALAEEQKRREYKRLRA